MAEVSGQRCLDAGHPTGNAQALPHACSAAPAAANAVRTPAASSAGDSSVALPRHTALPNSRPMNLEDSCEPSFQGRPRSRGLMFKYEHPWLAVMIGQWPMLILMPTLLL